MRADTKHIIEVGMQLLLAGLSLLNTKQYLENLGVKLIEPRFTTRFRKLIYSQLATGSESDCSGRDSDSDQRRTALTVHRYRSRDKRIHRSQAVSDENYATYRVFLREFREKQQIEQATFRVNGVHYLKAALDRLSSDCR